MRDARVRHDHDVGVHDRGEPRVVPEMTRAELADEHLRLRRRSEHRERHADVVVERRGARVDAEAAGEERPREVLRGGLPVRPGDRDH